MKLNVRFQENDAVLMSGISDLQQVTTLDSPAFTGTPTAPTAPIGTNSDQIATTSFVTRAVAIAHFNYGNIVTLNISEVTV